MRGKHPGHFNKKHVAPARVLGSVLLAGLLAACATEPRPAMPVAQEAAEYRAHAKSYYAPPGPPEDPWGPYIKEAAQRFDVPEIWIRSVMARESGGNLFRANGDFVTSAPGAMGLMQLMPPTYDELRVEYSLGEDPFNPHDNILAGAAYIREMYDIYGSPGFLAAYNGGPGRLDDFLSRHRTLPRETRNYVAAIGHQIAGYYPNSRSQADLMVAAHGGGQGVAYASASVPLSSEAKSVQAAWARRRNGDSEASDDQPVQVAEAQNEPAEATPAYTKSWKKVEPEAPTHIAIASAAPLSAAQSTTTESETDAVRAAWASRGAVAPAPTDPAPVQVAQAAPATPERRRLQLHFVTPAMAEPAPLLRKSSAVGERHDWAIQVGAFGSPTLAEQAADHAQERSSLASAKAQVLGVGTGKGHLYRARLTGLSHDAAVAACGKLTRGGPCVVVSPDSRF